MRVLKKIRPAGLTAWSDERLIKECRNGNQEAWNALLDKYKNLVYSIPLRYGLSRDDANDIFQQVCLQLITALPNLREPKSLAAWLIKVTSHVCFHWAGQQQHFRPFIEESEESRAVSSEMPDKVLREVERGQILREAISLISPRCRELIRMLFFEMPAVPYEELARHLGIARGSIGFIRMRCLKKLRQQLETKGFV